MALIIGQYSQMSRLCGLDYWTMQNKGFKINQAWCPNLFTDAYFKQDTEYCIELFLCINCVYDAINRTVKMSKLDKNNVISQHFIFLVT
jgi:hypothetical protein